MKDFGLDDSDGRLTEDELSRVVEQLCRSKADEFTMLGYENVTGKEIWACVSDRYKQGLPRLHQVVNDILSLRTTQYMNWMTMNVVYKGIRD